jgi:hypothetical protein
MQKGVKGEFFSFYVLSSTLLHLSPPRSNVSDDDGIEPGTVATLALTRSHPQKRVGFGSNSVLRIRGSRSVSKYYRYGTLSKTFEKTISIFIRDIQPHKF